jgi:hypothetical protein
VTNVLEYGGRLLLHLFMIVANGLIKFLENLASGIPKLPEGIGAYDPYLSGTESHRCASRFYQKYFNDQVSRHVLFGINPFRWGAGLTGIPFTDARRLSEKCGIDYNQPASHENASAFIYEVISEFGGPSAFYRGYLFNWVCPIGLLDKKIPGHKGYSYYQNAALYKSVRELMAENIRHLINLGIARDYCFCVGLGKNEQYLRKLNDEHEFFSAIIPLEHPGFITRYHAGERNKYLAHYVKQIKGAPKMIKL